MSLYTYLINSRDFLRYRDDIENFRQITVKQNKEFHWIIFDENQDIFKEEPSLKVSFFDQ